MGPPLINPLVVPIIRRLPRQRALTLLLSAALLAGTACQDKRPEAPGNAAPSPSAAAGEVTTNSAARGTTNATGATAISASAIGPTPEAERRAIEVATTGVGALPKRSRKDSVALASMTKGDSTLDKLWPVTMPPAMPGAVFPARRVVAFYGNPLSKKMGVLGEYPKDEMLAKLDQEVARWAKADPSHPVQPALHLIVTVAQGDPGKAGLYRLQMRDSMVNEIYNWAKAKRALLFLDVQVGKSSVQAEIPRLRPFLENPDVHLAIDPEFAMATAGVPPGKKIGTLDARDINYAVNFLDEIARSKNLPPKILIVHRFTRKMVSNAKDIKPTPHAQVVMDMDGWGPPWLKFDSYHDYIKKEPVQFTGFKLFFHNDTKSGAAMLTPAEVLRLNPKPLYVQYQ